MRVWKMLRFFVKGGLITFTLAVLNLPVTGLSQLASSSIEAAQKYSASHNGIGMIVQERGQLRYENYYNGYSGAPLHIYSGTKSFFGVLAVMAQEDGLFKLDDKASDTLEEWRGDPRKSEIRIRDLLNFTSGLETGFEEIYGRSSADRITLAVSLDATRDRGQSFVYGPGHINAFCEILRRKLKPKRMSYEQYMEKKLLGPLGIKMSRWREDPAGNPIPSAGMYMSGKEWLKFGEFINAGGVARGRTLVKTDSLAECFRGTSINPAFGLCFWLNGYAPRSDSREVDVEEDLELDPMPEDWSDACLAKGAPADLVVSLGSTFQRLYLVPSMDLIVVHHGKPGHEFRDFDFLQILFADAAAAPEPEPQKRKIKPLFPGLFKGRKQAQ
ncbi:MAG: serine hydrolase [Verrucomicrobiales bacterium]|nr:serine hydrolase [Verrucomicrobiales bacterium]